MGSIPVEEAKPARDFAPVHRCNARQMAFMARHDRKLIGSIFPGLGLEYVLIDWPSGLICPEPSACWRSTPELNAPELVVEEIVRLDSYPFAQRNLSNSAQNHRSAGSGGARHSNALPRPLRGDSLGLHLLDRLGHRDHPLCAFHMQVLDQLAVDDHNTLAACACC
jgi:hypothetical protein